MKSTAILQNEKSYDDIHADEVIALFKGEREGHYIHRGYDTPRQVKLWSTFIAKHKGYYVTRSETALIKMSAPVIGHLAKHTDGIIGIENGPGTPNAIKAKTIPFFLKMPELHTYIGRDWSRTICAELQSIMSPELPGVDIISQAVDFNYEEIPFLEKGGRRVFVEFGLTRLNIEGFWKDPFPEASLCQGLKNIRAQMRVDDFYVVTFDANQNEQEILNAYSNEWLALWGIEHLKVMKQTLPISGDFDPDSFYVAPRWIKDSHLSNNNFIALRTMDFEIAGQKITINKGHYFPFTNSYKPPVGLFSNIALNAGFEIINSIQDANKRLTVMTLKAS